MCECECKCVQDSYRVMSKVDASWSHRSGLRLAIFYLKSVLYFQLALVCYLHVLQLAIQHDYIDFFLCLTH